ncbi:HAD family hydrolase [Salinisphaera hydrothermalis]|uniref:Haloacid dehalogenase n=1 Tax=Salinisphaera hydrothermalis (strain C41B8) TaxID=1304275 RepID=A0A084IIJ1_SALHC|nr:HAD family hydrolase [Salinisphaera hydrothermalis]KEZ76525.1 haloacid dehalogenase [Salinisphaera hydrothermalis C41B8]
MRLTFFDLDQTLLEGDSDYEWGRFLVDEAVVDGPTYARANEQFKAQYDAGELDIHAYQRFVLQPLIDEPIARMHALRARFVAERIGPVVARQASAVVDFHRRRGDTLAIITATNRFVTEPIAELLGIEHLIATEPEVVDGAYTGAIAGTPSYREGKITRARDFVASLDAAPETITFYSDSHNDLPLLRWADRPVAVDPDPRLAAAAREAGWPVITLRGETMPAID